MVVARESSRPKVLIVGDGHSAAGAVGELVEKCGCEVVACVACVERGVEFLRQHDVDAAIVDADLDRMASFSICGQLKKREIPFVFLTSYGKSHTIPPEFQGAARLSKPVDGHEFEAVLAILACSGPKPRAPADRGNLVLERLPPADWRLLQPRLEQVSMETGETLETPDGETRYVYFPITGLVSVCASSANGRRIEIGLVGCDGVTGTAALLGGTRRLETEAIVQHPGLAWRIAVPPLEELLRLRPDFHIYLLHAVHAFMGQVARNMLAIGYGTIEQRLARRLLMTSLRLGTMSLTLTHDSLSKMLAVRRSGVTVALHMLEARQMIRTKRNLVEILDYGALVREAGETCWMAADYRIGAAD